MSYSSFLTNRWPLPFPHDLTDSSSSRKLASLRNRSQLLIANVLFSLYDPSGTPRLAFPNKLHFPFLLFSDFLLPSLLNHLLPRRVTHRILRPYPTHKIVALSERSLLHRRIKIYVWLFRSTFDEFQSQRIKGILFYNWGCANL